MAKLSRSGKVRSNPRDDSEDMTPALPAWKAFVVQFTRETGVIAGAFAGRVEHLSTGQMARFDSSQELVEFVQAVLQHETGSTPR